MWKITTDYDIIGLSSALVVGRFIYIHALTTTFINRNGIVYVCSHVIENRFYLVCKN